MPSDLVEESNNLGGLSPKAGGTFMETIEN